MGLFVRPFRRAAAGEVEVEVKENEDDEDDAFFLREASGLGLLGFETR